MINSKVTNIFNNLVSSVDGSKLSYFHQTHMKIKDPDTNPDIILNESIHGRIAMISQPKGGYVSSDLIKSLQFEDYKKLKKYKEDDVHRFSTLMTPFLNMWTNFINSHNANEAFLECIVGIRMALDLNLITQDFINSLEKEALFQEKVANWLKNQIDFLNHLDFTKIDEIDLKPYLKVALELSSFYYVARTFIAPKIQIDSTLKSDNVFLFEEIPNYIYENCLIMINRIKQLIDLQKPILTYDLTLSEQNGQISPLITFGLCNIISQKALINIRASEKDEVSADQTLEILIYWIMLNHHETSTNAKFINIDNLCIFNPFLNILYSFNAKAVSNEIIDEIKTQIIGYNLDLEKGVRIDLDSSFLAKKALGHLKKAGLKSYQVYFKGKKVE